MKGGIGNDYAEDPQPFINQLPEKGKEFIQYIIS